MSILKHSVFNSPQYIYYTYINNAILIFKKVNSLLYSKSKAKHRSGSSSEGLIYINYLYNPLDCALFLN